MQIPIINSYILPNIYITLEDEEVPYNYYQKLLKGLRYLRIFLFHNREDNKIHFYVTCENKLNLLNKLNNYNLYNKILIELNDFYQTYYLTIDNKDFTNNCSHKLLNIMMTIKLLEYKKVGFYNYVKAKILIFNDIEEMNDKIKSNIYRKLLHIFAMFGEEKLNDIYEGYGKLKVSYNNVNIFFQYTKTNNGIKNITIKIIK